MKYKEPKSDLSKYANVIVTDGNGKPMSFSGGQFCYCTNSDWQDEQFPVRVYSKSQAKLLIKKSAKYREENNLSIDISYKTIPVLQRN